MTQQRLLRIDEVAFFLDVSESTIRRLLKRGLLQAAKIGNQWRIADVDLQRFLKANVVNGRGEHG